MCSHIDNLLVSTFRRSISGMLIRDPPIRKCAGVKAVRSLGSQEMRVKGLGFNIDSISIIKVLNCSYVNIALPTVRCKCC